MSSATSFILPVVDILAAVVAPELAPLLCGAETGLLGAAGVGATAAGLGALGAVGTDIATNQPITPLGVIGNAAATGAGGFIGAGGLGALGNAVGIGSSAGGALGSSAGDVASNLGPSFLGADSAGASGAGASLGAGAASGVAPPVVGGVGQAAGAGVGTAAGAVAADPLAIGATTATNVPAADLASAVKGAAQAPSSTSNLFSTLGNYAQKAATPLNLASLAAKVLGPQASSPGSAGAGQGSIGASLSQPSPGSGIGQPQYAQAANYNGGYASGGLLGSSYNAETGAFETPQQTNRQFSM